MKPITLTRRGQLRAYIEPLEPLGYNPERILEAGSLSSWLHGATNDWVPVHCVGKVLAMAARAVGDENYGFWVAERGPISDIPVIGKLVSQSSTLYDGLRTVCSLITGLNTDLKIWLAEDNEKFWFCRSEPRGLDDGRLHMEQYVLRKMVQVVRLGLGRN